MSEFVVLCISLLVCCVALPAAPLSRYSANDLLAMIQQMNATLVKQEDIINQQSSAILGLNRTDRISTKVGFYARLMRHIPTLGSGGTLVFDEVVTNIGNVYDKDQGFFTAPVSGMYSLSASIMSLQNTKLHCAIVKNGMNVGNLYGGLTDYQADTATIVLELQASDRVWVKHLVGSGYANQKVNVFYSYFSGFLIN